MTTLATLFGHAVAAHRAGNLGRAAQIYHEILAVEPAHARANHLLGFILLQRGAPAEAVPRLTAGLRQSPNMADAWAHLGLALNATGRSTRAATALRRSLVLAPATLEAATGLLRAAQESGLPIPESIATRVVVLAPLQAAGWHGLGLARATRASGSSKAEDGTACLRRAALLDPADRPAVSDLADVVRNRREPDSALRVGRWAARLSPASTAVRSTLAAILFDLDRVTEADRAARQAAVLAPGNARAYGNRAQCQYRVGRPLEAIADGRRAVAIEPRNPQIRANLGSYHLAAGELDRGWGLFRHRPSRLIVARTPGLPTAAWSGEAGARLLVLAEQGLGDELLFATCWPDLAARVRDGRLAAVLVEVDARLRPLAERSYPEFRWIDRDRTAAIDRAAPACESFAPTHWVAAGDLPALFRRRIEDFPQDPRGLVADAGRARAFREWMDEAAPGLSRVGFCWRSGLQTGDRRKHYPALSQCGALLRLSGARLVVMQYDDCADEIAAVMGPSAPPLLVPPDLDQRDDLDGVAALMTALDLVVSAETAVLALAGATRNPAVGFAITAGWVALGRPCPPWFRDQMKVYRRPDEDWEAAMARVAQEAARRIPESKEPGGKATRLD